VESPKLSPTDGYWVFLKPLLPGEHPIHFSRSCRVVVRSKQIYFAAISVAQDVKLRQSIRESVEKESELLGSIGFAHMEQEIQRKVIVMSKEYKDRLTKKTGLESSLNEMK
jgi:negative regulator of replication initiation